MSCIFQTIAFVTVTENNSLSFKLFLFKLGAFLNRSVLKTLINLSLLALVQIG